MEGSWQHTVASRESPGRSVGSRGSAAGRAVGAELLVHGCRLEILETAWRKSLRIEEQSTFTMVHPFYDDVLRSKNSRIVFSKTEGWVYESNCHGPDTF
jgi:hypothetical protein